MKKLKHDPVTTKLAPGQPKTAKLAPGQPQTAHFTFSQPSPKVNIKTFSLGCIALLCGNEEILFEYCHDGKGSFFKLHQGPLTPGVAMEFVQLKVTAEGMQKACRKRQRRRARRSRQGFFYNKMPDLKSDCIIEP